MALLRREFGKRDFSPWAADVKFFPDDESVWYRIVIDRIDPQCRWKDIRTFAHMLNGLGITAMMGDASERPVADEIWEGQSQATLLMAEQDASLTAETRPSQPATKRPGIKAALIEALFSPKGPCLWIRAGEMIPRTGLIKEWMSSREDLAMVAMKPLEGNVIWGPVPRGVLGYDDLTHEEARLAAFGLGKSNAPAPAPAPSKVPTSRVATAESTDEVVSLADYRARTGK
ncbi:MAG: hypothetical protein K2Q12_01625 [Rickettsiales bacterium]|nr:hypothetical protein [Rickettsiales bacterium]